MGILESRPAQSTATPSSSPAETPNQQNEEQFKTEVRKSAENFKNLVMNNKIMMFSATYCSYCTVAKVETEIELTLGIVHITCLQRTLDDLGTQFQSMEVNKEGRDGEMMMDIVEAVTGNRMVPAIFICGQLVPGGGSGLKHLASTGQLSEILGKCCEGDITCKKFDKYSLH